MRWLCRHQWGKWGEDFSIGSHRFQRRTCKRCGKTIQRRIGWRDPKTENGYR